VATTLSGDVLGTLSPAGTHKVCHGVKEEGSYNAENKEYRGMKLEGGGKGTKRNEKEKRREG
jgi:hypothetical protein